MSAEPSRLPHAPDFVLGNPLLERILDFARQAYADRGGAADGRIDHSLQVAMLLHAAGYDDEVVAAGLLHDAVGDSTADLDQIEAVGGPEVSGMVAAMTEDLETEPYERRKAEHRLRITREDRVVGAVYAAESLVNVRALAASDKAPPPRALRHYRRTVQMLGRVYPGLPFLDELKFELDALIRRGAR
jgi:(p)ppGpp synthase/HD superfamily hydrolase